MKPLCSIIVPTYNRSDLIGKTLDSVIAQTYKSWECIVVDDGSTDSSEAVLKEYASNDPRIQYFKRPQHSKKGANTCRNIGLEKAKGTYIVFFDSDDLMTPDHLEVKLENNINQDVDFVITKTAYFNKPEHITDHVYKFDRFSLTLSNYLAQNINWLTLDICMRATVIKDIRFNEKLQSGQEFNFYSKLLAKTENGFFVPKIVSLRRHHHNSIQSRLKDKKAKHLSSYISKWNTYLDLRESLTKIQKKIIVYKCIKEIIHLKKVPKPDLISVLLAAFKIFGYRGFYLLGFLCLKPFNTGYYFIDKLHKMGEDIFLRINNK